MKNKVIIFIFLILMILFTGCSCGNAKKQISVSGEIVTDKFELSTAKNLYIHDIYLKSGGVSKLCNVTLNEGSKKYIDITYNESLRDSFTVKVTNDTLNIYANKYEEYLTEMVKIDIYGYNFSEINASTINLKINKKTVTENFCLNASSASSINFDDLTFKTLDVSSSGASVIGSNNLKVNELFDLNISGASVITYTNCNFNECKFNISGASYYNATGLCKKLTLDISGASIWNNREFVIEDVILESSGASVLTLNCSKTLNVKASGLSDITLYGNCEIVKEKVTGGSTVKRK